jgi:hypothetical protein
MPDGCHVVFIADATPGTLDGLSRSPFADFIERYSR